MPRKPRNATTLDVPADRAAQIPTFVVPAPPPPAPPTSAVEERRDRELDELIEAIGTDGRLTVWHIIDGRAVYAGNMSLDGFSLQAVLETYGGGDKSLVFYQGKQKVDTFRVSLDPTVPPTSPTKAKLTAAAPAANGAAAGGSGLADISSFIAASAQAQLANMQAMANMQQASQQNMATMIQAMTAAMTAQPRTDPIALVTAIMAAVKDHGTPASTAPTKELLDMFERGLNISERLSGGDGDDVTHIVGKGVETLGVLIEGIVAEKKANAARIAAGGVPVVAGNGVGGGDAAGTVDGLGDGTEHIGTPRRIDGVSVTGQLTHHGAAGHAAPVTGASDAMATATERPTWAPEGFSNITVQAFNWLTPDEAAALISNRLSDEQFDALLDDIEAPGFGDRLVRYFPAAAHVDPNWIGQLITILLTDNTNDDGDGAPSPEAA